jgi:diguanylate cyclase (GGDEF)-like protein
MAFLLLSPVTAFSLALVGVAMLNAVLGLFILHQRMYQAAANYFAWLMLGMAWWSGGYALEIFFPALAAKYFWARVQYAGIALIPFFWLVFVLEFMGQRTLLTRRNKILALLVPSFTLLAVWTNDYHHLYYAHIDLIQYGEMSLLGVEHGPLFWVHVAYAYLLLAGGSFFLVTGALRSPTLFRSQIVALLLAALFPWLGNLIYLLGWLPIRELDPTPFGFTLTAISVTWAMQRYRLLQIWPPAPMEILQVLRDGVVVVDENQRVVYMNHAAEKILGKNAMQCVGESAEQVCDACRAILPFMLAAEPKNTVLPLEVEGAERTFEVVATPLFAGKDDSRDHLWHLVIFYDATQRVRAEAELYRREAILLAVSKAATNFLGMSKWEENIPLALAQLGMAANVSRVYIFERYVGADGVPRVSQRYEWVKSGVTPQIDNPDLQNLDWRAAGYSRWEEILLRGESIVAAVRSLPLQERELLQQQDILSIAIIPIFSGDVFWGFIGFDDCEKERSWSQAEISALQTAAEAFGAAVMRNKIEIQLRRNLQLQQLLQEILRAALEKNNMLEMAQFLVEHLGELIGADNCFLTLWDEASGRTIPYAAYGFPTDVYRRLDVQPSDKTLTAAALEAGRPLVIPNVQNSPYLSKHIARQFSTVSMLVVPMIADGKKQGAILLGFTQPHSFTPEEIVISEQAAGLVSLALLKFQAVELAQRRAEEAEMLRRAGMAIAETLNFNETIERILEQLAQVLPYDSASVQLLHQGELEIVGGKGWDDPAAVIGMRFPVPGDNPNSRVIETRQPYVLGNAAAVYASFRQPPHDHIRSWLGVPLLVRNQVVGLLAIDSREPYHFTAEHVNLAMAFASQVAVVIENARLFEATQQMAITDPLTGLYNRRRFMELAQQEFERARRYKRRLSLMMFDIDHFKQVNDSYGHLAGDQVLQSLAALCKQKLREADPIGRYGGEEFVALVIEADRPKAYLVGERLRREVENMRISTPEGEIRITVSVGIASLTKDVPDLQTLISHADQALYLAKQKGRNRVVMMNEHQAMQRKSPIPGG